MAVGKSPSVAKLEEAAHGRTLFAVRPEGKMLSMRIPVGEPPTLRVVTTTAIGFGGHIPTGGTAKVPPFQRRSPGGPIK